MDITKLTATVSILITLSIASERLVEIIKGLIPSLNQENPDPVTEGWRRAKIQFLAVVAGIFTAWMASFIPDSGIKDNYFAIAAFGLLASGGSAFWNSILEYLLRVKDIKEIEAEKKKELKTTEVANAKELGAAKVEAVQLEIEKKKHAPDAPPLVVN